MRGLRVLARPAAYLALAVALTWPLALDPLRQVVGAPRSDVWNSLWGLWFVARQGGPWPAWTDLLDWPEGGRIVVADPLNALLALPLTRAVGPVGAYAALVVGHVALAGWAADRLGRAVGGRGWVAGVSWALAPVALANLNNGSSEAISAGWLPLAALAVLRAVERGGLGRSLLAGFALAVCALGGWYAGVDAWLFVAAVLLAGWAGVPLRARLARLLPGLLLALAVTAPWAATVRSVALADDGLVDIKHADDLARIRRTLGAADPRTLVVPGDFRSPDFPNLEGNPGDFVHTAYLGWVLVGLAVAGTLRRRREGEAGRAAAWWLAGALGVVLALGPVVVVDGRPWDPFGIGIAVPLPYRLLEGLPGFGSLSLLYRLAALGSLALSVLADRLHPAWAAAVAAEVLLVSPVRGLPPVVPVPEAGPLAAIAQSGLDGAVLNLPPTAQRTYLYEQVLHGRPVVAALNTGINRAGLEVMRAARAVRRGEAPAATLAEVARHERVRWVVTHRDMLMDVLWIGSLGGVRMAAELVAEDERLRVFRLY